MFRTGPQRVAEIGGIGSVDAESVLHPRSQLVTDEGQEAVGTAHHRLAGKAVGDGRIVRGREVAGALLGGLDERTGPVADPYDEDRREMGRELHEPDHVHGAGEHAVGIGDIQDRRWGGARFTTVTYEDLELVADVF